VWSTYQKLGDIVDLQLVQWGNTQGDGTIANTKCQHGPPECKTMMVYACNKYGAGASADGHAKYVECFDQLLMKTFPAGLPEGSVNLTFAEYGLKTCATQLSLDYDALDECSSGPEGEKYFAMEGKKTPAHMGVPFVTINGGPILYNNQTLNLITEVCKAYTGSPKPAACADAELELSPYSYTSLMTPACAATAE